MAFFDKLGEMARNVTDLASDSLETSRLTGDINLQKGNIQCYQRELGEYYWAKFAVGEQLDDEAMLICDKIVEAQDMIRDLEAQIDQIKAEREAEKAERKAAKEAEEAAKEAEKAAKAAEEAEEKAAAAEAAGENTVNVCADCGAVLAEGQKFCGFCGKPVA